jgi:HK97 family phage major capsid protein
VSDNQSRDQLFLEYLRNYGKPEAKDILAKLRNPDVRPGVRKIYSRVELEVPEFWKKELMSRVHAKSLMLKELKSRTSTSDRIVQPSLVGEPSSRVVTSKGGEKITVVEDQYSQISVMKEMKKFIAEDIDEAAKIDLSEYLLDTLSSEIASYIDRAIVSDSQTEKVGLQSILINSQVATHESKGMGTVAGYITLGEDIADAFVSARKHLPNGYSVKAKWIMNSTTFDKLKTMKITPTEEFPTDNPITTAEDNGPEEILGKPVIINEYMPSTGIVAILADLSRGYIMASPTEMSLIIGSDSSTYLEVAALKTYLGGQVLQPACFKLIKFDAVAEVVQ